MNINTPCGTMYSMYSLGGLGWDPLLLTEQKEFFVHIMKGSRAGDKADEDEPLSGILNANLIVFV